MPNDKTTDQRFTLVISGPELNLVRTGLKLLLEAEDDAQEIEWLKSLIARLPLA